WTLTVLIILSSTLLRKSPNRNYISKPTLLASSDLWNDGCATNQYSPIPWLGGISTSRSSFLPVADNDASQPCHRRQERDRGRCQRAQYPGSEFLSRSRFLHRQPQ